MPKLTDIKQLHKGLIDVLDKYQNFFFDLDGVLWRGEESLPGSLYTLNKLRQQNKNLFFITNSSVRDRQELMNRFGRYGFKVDREECFPSSYISALYLTTKYPQIKRVMVFGTRLLVKELEAAGLAVKHIIDFQHYDLPVEILKTTHMDQTIQAIVMGWDNSMTYSKNCLISFHLQNGVKFFGTNPDRYTMIGGYKIPGTGSIISAIETSTGIAAEIMGKPNTFIIDQIIEKKQLTKQSCIMIGDSMETDVPFGNRAGIDTLCVLTGVSTQEQVEAAQGQSRPKYYAKQLSFQ